MMRPKRETCPSLRATIPSTKSVAAAKSTVKNTNQVPRLDTGLSSGAESSQTIASTTSRMRSRVMAFASFTALGS
jgi:hypothetical protein